MPEPATAGLSAKKRSPEIRAPALFVRYFWGRDVIKRLRGGDSYINVCTAVVSSCSLHLASAAATPHFYARAPSTSPVRVRHSHVHVSRSSSYCTPTNRGGDAPPATPGPGSSIRPGKPPAAHPLCVLTMICRRLEHAKIAAIGSACVLRGVHYGIHLDTRTTWGCSQAGRTAWLSH